MNPLMSRVSLFYPSHLTKPNMFLGILYTFYTCLLIATPEREFSFHDPTILPMASLASKGYPPNSLHDSRDRATDILPLQVRASK